jgi:hypothetical protein
MKDLQRRLQLIKKVLQQPLSDKDKIIHAYQALSGLNLTPLPLRIRHLLESSLVASNQIMQQYPIKTFDDYEIINREHLQELVGNITRLHKKLSLLIKVKK